MIDINKLQFQKLNGLIPAIITDSNNGQVLMLGFMNEAALKTTIETGRVTFFSRTKNRLWTKGETSGNFLKVLEISADCDNDTLLVRSQPTGPVCHTSSKSCFSEAAKPVTPFLAQLFALIKQRKEQLPVNSYTTRLFMEGRDRIIQKVGEEAVEVVIAAKNGRSPEIISESADLLFHMLVLLAELDLSPELIIQELQKRWNK